MSKSQVRIKCSVFCRINKIIIEKDLQNANSTTYLFKAVDYCKSAWTNFIGKSFAMDSVRRHLRFPLKRKNAYEIPRSSTPNKHHCCIVVKLSLPRTETKSSKQQMQKVNQLEEQQCYFHSSVSNLKTQIRRKQQKIKMHHYYTGRKDEKFINFKIKSK